MIVRIHKKGSNFGHSFKGLGAYLLHDQGASTSERVEWTETRNLATTDPEMAWRIMAATAMDQDRLKEQAAVKNTGRKSNASVLHLALSWAEDERETLTREAMLKAADTILYNLGKDTTKSAKNGRAQFANEHQSLIVCHSDSKNPHVHIMINRVHPQHGVMLPSSNDFLKASKFGLEYEQNTGRIRCTNRAINWQARQRGEFARDTQSLPRNIYEQRKEAANTNTPNFEQAVQQQRKKDADLARNARDIKKRHRQEMKNLADQYREKLAQLEARTAASISIAKQKVRDEFRPKWEYRFHEKVAEQRRFEIDEEKFLGKVMNFARSVDFKAFLNADNRRQALRQTFDALSSSGGREQALKRQQEAKDRQLQVQQGKAEKAAASPALQERDKQKASSRDLFLAERSQLVLAHRMDRAATRTQWATRDDQRKESYRAHGNDLQDGSGLKPELQSSLEAAKEKIRIVEQFKRSLQGRERQPEHDQSKGRGR